MKFRPSVLLALSLGIFAAPAVHAQTASLPGPPPPPAAAIAQRLMDQSDAAKAYASALAPHDPSASAFQKEIAHRRSYQAVQKYKAICESRTYGQTPYAAEAYYKQAIVEETELKDKNAAIQSLKMLHNKLGTVDFPDKVAAKAAMARLEAEVDHENKTTWPGSILYSIMDFLVHLTGAKSYSYVLAILMISILVKLALTPLSNKQYASMKEQQKLQPIIKELQAKYKDDKEAQGRKMMEVYKEHNVNPAAGCVPLVVQLPILWLLYYMIRLYEYQFAHGTFLWIGSGLSHLYPQYIAPDLGQQDIPLLLLYALSMYVQQKMMVSPDPQQAEQQRMMAIMTPFMSTYFFLQWHLPSAFVLYYLIFNILSTGQQYYYMNKRGKDEGGDAQKITNSGSTAALPLQDIKIQPAKPTSNGNGTHTNGAHANGSLPTAKGLIAPKKIHPKKKRR